MPTTLVPMICPTCRANVQVPTDRDKFYCQFCGTQLVVDKGETTIHVHTYDEAALKRLALEERRLALEEQHAEDREHAYREQQDAAQLEMEAYRKGWRKKLLIFIGAMLLLAAAGNSYPKGSSEYESLSTVLGAVLLFGSIYLFVIRPSKKEKELARQPYHA